MALVNIPLDSEYEIATLFFKAEIRTHKLFF